MTADRRCTDTGLTITPSSARHMDTITVVQAAEVWYNKRLMQTCVRKRTAKEIAGGNFTFLLLVSWYLVSNCFAQHSGQFMENTTTITWPHTAFLYDPASPVSSSQDSSAAD